MNQRLRAECKAMNDPSSTDKDDMMLETAKAVVLIMDTHQKMSAAIQHHAELHRNSGTMMQDFNKTVVLLTNLVQDQGLVIAELWKRVAGDELPPSSSGVAGQVKPDGLSDT